MVFSSVVFVFYFIPLFFAAYVLSRFSKWILLVFSLVFYAWGEPIFLLLMVGMILVNHRFGLCIEGATDRRVAKCWLLAGIATNLAPLILFKYGAFLLHAVLGSLAVILTRKFGIAPGKVTIHHLILPLGISFYTFHSLSYLIDVYRKDVPAERSLRDLAVYISMFPQLIAGPIIRYKTIARELHKPFISLERAAEGVQLFVVGLSQKVLIANTVAASADQIFGLPFDQLSTPLSWVGIVCYTMQIYFDFGGYSNMALGLGLMIGFTYPINFNYPYVAQSMTEFWRRWHISLSSWFRDYVYIPLGGNRVSAGRTYFNLCVVFLLCGLWHGAAWTFVAWGAAHGAFLVMERMGMGRVFARAPRLVRHAYTLAAVMGTWVLFRESDFGSAAKYLATMVGAGTEISAAPPLHRFLGMDVVLALAGGVLTAGPYGAEWGRRLGKYLTASSLEFGAMAGLALLLMLDTLSLAGGAYNPFIYFRF